MHESLLLDCGNWMLCTHLKDDRLAPACAHCQSGYTGPQLSGHPIFEEKLVIPF